MDTGLFARLVPELKELCSQVYLHVLGEPLLHPRLASFLGMLEEASLPVAITTNGSLLGRQGELLLECKVLRQVNFSLHALREPSLPVDGEAVLRQVLDFCLMALERRPDLHVNLRFWNLEAREAEADPWSARVKERIVEALGVQWVPPVPGRKHRRLAGLISVHQDTRFVWPAESVQVHAPREKGYCQALHSHFAVLVDGRVVPCCLDAEGDMELGRVQAHSLRQILSGPRSQRMRTGFGEGKLVEDLCRTCDYCRRFKKQA